MRDMHLAKPKIMLVVEAVAPSELAIAGPYWDDLVAAAASSGTDKNKDTPVAFSIPIDGGNLISQVIVGAAIAVGKDYAKAGIDEVITLLRKLLEKAKLKLEEEKIVKVSTDIHEALQ